MNNSKTEILYNEKLNVVEVHWNGYMKSEAYRNALDLAYQKIVTVGATA